MPDMLHKYSIPLKKFDDPVHWQQPGDFDRKQAEVKAEAFYSDLKGMVRVSLGFETGASIQDAPFHSQIYIAVSGEVVSLRFSNFGNLTAIMGEAVVPPAYLVKIQDLLKRHGYTYIPEHVLEEPYIGAHQGMTGMQDWWVRYFDWA